MKLDRRDFEVIKPNGKLNVIMILQEGEENIKQFTPQTSDDEVERWLQGYIAGYNVAYDSGKSLGQTEIANKILDALGIRGQINELENNVKILGSVLYWHDGICKEDVSKIAGRD